MTINPTPSLQFAPMRPVTPRSVAVIGAGAGGLVAARELRREGHKVVVFEREDKVGGTWVYNPNIDSDPIGIDPSRNVVQSSLYASLRTNLPREVMGCREYPFVATNKSQRDPRRFPGHREVLEYLNDYVSEFGLSELVRFGTEVTHVGLVEEGKWKVRSRIGEDRVDEIYDAVVVCNGHYTEPRIAEIPGIDVWPGKQIHSHNYRVPEPFQDQVVILIGSSASAVDISRDIAAVAKEVHIASRSVKKDGTLGKLPGYENMWLHSMIENVHEDGTVVFKDGGAVCADVILHCTGFYSRHAGTSLVAFGTENSRSGQEDHRALETVLRLHAAIKNRSISEVSDIIGEECQCVCSFNSIKYKYYFPFLDTNGIVAVDDNRVGPLYKHIFPPFLAPGLSFVGLPFKVVPFPLFEFQSKWIAGVLSGRLVLPSPEEMLADVEAFYLTLEASGVPKRYTHNLADYQFKYDDWLAAECGCPPVEEWRKEMYFEASKNKLIRPETYRNEWDDHHLVSQAHEDFGKYLSNGDLGEIIPQYLQQHLKI